MTDQHMPKDDHELLLDLQRRVTNNEANIKLLIETSVASGIRQAVADPQTWDAFFQAMGNRAQAEAGRATVGGLKWLGLRMFWGIMAGLVLYYVGGWSMLAAAIKAIGTGH